MIKPVSWIAIVLTVVAFVFTIISIPHTGSFLDYIVFGIIIVWFASVLLVGVALILLKHQMMGILTLLFFPIGIFAAPHLLGFSGVFANLFEGVRFFLQFMLPIWASVLLILKGNPISDR
ncbi:MAG: hypothetical protein AB8G77_01640 [Rhodothermales bacterium]